MYVVFFECASDLLHAALLVHVRHHSVGECIIVGSDE